MDTQLNEARQHFIQGMSRISSFWGFPRAMGAIYGAIYLSQQPISLDDIVTQVGVTKGSVSTNVRMLERLNMVHKKLLLGDRKDYYLAETDFWKIVRSVLRQREQSEFDLALRTVGESISLVQEANVEGEGSETADFYQTRMQNMQQFFNSLDNLVATMIALDDLRANTIQKLFGKLGSD
jgi:HTH-type transcriptional regulator, glycine betaine synthesis regulator